MKKEKYTTSVSLGVALALVSFLKQTGGRRGGAEGFGQMSTRPLKPDKRVEEVNQRHEQKVAETCFALLVELFFLSVGMKTRECSSAFAGW